jgi:hypothetical protein
MQPQISNAIVMYIDGWKNEVPAMMGISQAWIAQAFSDQST